MEISIATMGHSCSGGGEHLPTLQQDLIDAGLFLGGRLTERRLNELRSRFDDLIPRVDDTGVFIDDATKTSLHERLSLLLGQFERQCRGSRKLKL